MVRNTLAIQTLPGAPKYFWRTEKGQPADAFKPDLGEGWLWPLSGVRIGTRLYLFMMQMIANGEGAFGFAFLKSVLVIVDNPDDDPAAWALQQKVIPHVRRSPDGDLFFGGACVLHEGTLYIYGVRENPGKGKGIVVAKVDATSISDFGSWAFFNGKVFDHEAKLGRDASFAQPVFSDGSVEMSVTPIPGGFAAVYTSQGMSREIVLRRAPHPWGHWSAPEVIHRCVEPLWSKNYFCYAAKAHPELAASERELVVTYACNSMSFPEVVNDLRIYRPRFVRVPLD
jgi:hypothetical protein